MDRWQFQFAGTPEERREARIVQLVGIGVGLVLGAIVFVALRTGWSPLDALRSWFGLAP